MARPLRITYPGAFYHVTSRGNERKAVFKSRQYSGARLKEIGAFFGIGESGVSQASRRIEEIMKSSRTLKRKMKAVENKLFLSRVKT